MAFGVFGELSCLRFVLIWVLCQLNEKQILLHVRKSETFLSCVRSRNPNPRPFETIGKSGSFYFDLGEEAAEDGLAVPEGVAQRRWRPNRTKMRKLNAVWPTLPESIKKMFYNCGQNGRNRQAEQNELVDSLFMRDPANGRDWMVDKESYLFKQTITRTDDTTNADGKMMLPRAIMLEKFTVTGEASICKLSGTGFYKIYALKVSGVMLEALKFWGMHCLWL